MKVRVARLWYAVCLAVLLTIGAAACDSVSSITTVAGHPGMHTQTVTSGSATYTVYWRDTTSTTRGGLLLVHGGGWTGGDRSRFTPQAEALADAGFVAATVDYRLADGTAANAWPVQMQDVLSGWRALRNNASTYQLNISRLALAGESSGGHLVLAAAEAMLPTERPSALVSWSGPTDLVAWMTNPQPTCRGNECYYFNGLGPLIQNDLLRCSYSACPSRYAAASPARNVVSALPPVLQTFYTRDIVPVAQGRAMDAALRAHGGRSTLLTYPDFGHGVTWTPQP